MAILGAALLFNACQRQDAEVLNALPGAGHHGEGHHEDGAATRSEGHEPTAEEHAEPEHR